MRTDDSDKKDGLGRGSGIAGPGTASGGGDPEDLQVYDHTLKMLLRRYPQLVVPLVNEAFGTNYPPDAPVELLNTEHMNTWGATYSDVAITIAGEAYHLEGQSTGGSGMDKRMVQYDFSIALEHIGAGGLRKAGLSCPDSCLINLRRRGPIGASRFPVRFGTNDAATYGYVVLNAAGYSMDDIFRRHLLFLFPFYLMRYDSDTIRVIEGDNSLSENLVEECNALRMRLEDETLKKGEKGLFIDLVSYAIKVSDKLFAKSKKLGQKVRKAMGETYIKTFQEDLIQKEGENEQMKLAIAEKDRTIAEQHKTIAEKDRAIADQDRAIADQDRAIANQDRVIAKKDRTIAKKDRVIAKKDKTIAEQHKTIEELKRQLRERA